VRNRQGSEVGKKNREMQGTGGTKKQDSYRHSVKEGDMFHITLGVGSVPGQHWCEKKDGMGGTNEGE